MMNLYKDDEYEQRADDEYTWSILMDIRLDLNDLCDGMMKRKSIATTVKNSTAEERKAVETVQRMIARMQEPTEAEQAASLTDKRIVPTHNRMTVGDGETESLIGALRERSRLDPDAPGVVVIAIDQEDK